MTHRMSRNTFDRLKALRSELASSRNVLEQTDGQLAGIFIPWVGSELETRGGIYYVGIATNGEFGGDQPQEFDTQWAETESLCHGESHQRSGTPFWRFLNGLSLALLGGRFESTRQRWAWSNLLKIGWSVEPLPKWLPKVQSDICSEALREETSGLRNTLIFIATAEDHNLLARWIGDVEWSKERSSEGIYWMFDKRTGNLWVHGYHPAARVLKGDVGFQKQLSATIGLARAHLEWARTEETGLPS